MFRLFRKKKPTSPADEPSTNPAPAPDAWAPDKIAPTAPSIALPAGIAVPPAAAFDDDDCPPAQPEPEAPPPILSGTPSAPPAPPEPQAFDVPSEDLPALDDSTVASLTPPVEPPAPETGEMVGSERTGWMGRLRSGLKKTGGSITGVFTSAKIDDALYEELEMALLMADVGVNATEFLLDDLKQRVRQTRTTEPAQVQALLQDAVADLLKPLEKTLDVGIYHPTVIMVAGVNGAGKTTSIGKLTKHLADAGAHVLLAAADTFRAAAREQLEVWADRNRVEIISQQDADPSAVSFDAVAAGRARDMDVVLVDTAGRLPTQKHLMQELAKIRRVVTKADFTAPHESLLVIDGNTGQNALAQVKAFDEILQLTGLIVTKLDGTAKGGVLCALAREYTTRPIPVYFIGVGEQLADLQPFDAREFAQALLG